MNYIFTYKKIKNNVVYKSIKTQLYIVSKLKFQPLFIILKYVQWAHSVLKLGILFLNIE